MRKKLETFAVSLKYYRLLVSCAKILQRLPEQKRDGDSVLQAVQSETLFDESSTSRAMNILAQSEDTTLLVRKLQENRDQVIKDFEDIRKHCVCF